MSVKLSKEDWEKIRARAKPVFIERDEDAEIGMDVTDYEDGSFYTEMAPCPNCKTNENLRIKCDLASLNALEYWVKCEQCGEEWTDRMLGDIYANDPQHIVDLWNKKFG